MKIVLERIGIRLSITEIDGKTMRRPKGLRSLPALSITPTAWVELLLDGSSPHVQELKNLSYIELTYISVEFREFVEVQRLGNTIPVDQIFGTPSLS